jgi:uncharacterized protein (DUF488 family)
VGSTRLFTIGYEGRTVAELVDVLRGAGVERVVDVRELPLSRRRGFSKPPLAAALAEAGIAYEHARELGNPKEIRERFRLGDTDAGLGAYRAHLYGKAYPAVVDLAASLGSSATCLLCLEADHERCHRSVIASAVAERLPELDVVRL